MRRNPARLVVPVAAAGALLLAGCGGGSDDQSSAGSSESATGGGTLTLGATLDMYGWQPENQPGYQNWAAEAVWDGLIKIDGAGEAEEDIAETWEIVDSTTFTADLRDGLSFTDGSPVDTAAVEASFQYTIDQGNADYAGVTMEVVDDDTISITWPEPTVVIADRVAAVKIMPVDYLEAMSWDVPVGSGPYIYDPAASTTGSTYTFAKNPDHWNADHYPFEELVVKVFESDTATVSALKTGQIDASLVNNASVAEVEASSFDVEKFQGQTTRLIISDHLGEVEPALGDVRVRQAMNMVVDKQAMADNLYLGNATPAVQVFRPGTLAYIDGMEDPYPYDVAAAQALMEEAGYADGFELELPTMEGQNFETLMPYVKQQLAEINITVTEVPLSGSNAIGDLLSGTYPVVLWQLGNLANSAQQIFVEATPEGWWNLQHQPDEYVDSRYAQLPSATPEESAQLQQEINQYIVDQAWFAPMVLTGTNFAYDGSVVSIPTQSDQEALTPKLRDFQLP